MIQQSNLLWQALLMAIVFHVSSSAQAQKASAFQRDSIQIAGLLEETEHYLYKNNDSARYLIRQAGELISTRSHPEQYLQYNSLLSTIMREHGLMDSAIIVRQRNLAFIDQLDAETKSQLRFVLSRAASIGDIASYYRRKGDHETSLRYNQQALDIYDSLRKLNPEDKDVLNRYGRGLNAMAVTHASFGSDSSARIYFKRSLKFYRENDFPENATYTLFNIGANYLDNEQYDSAIHYLQFAKDLIDSLDIDRLKPYILQNLSHAYINSDYIQQARPLLEEFIRIGKERNNTQILARAYSHMSNYQRHIGNYDQAIDYAQKGLAMKSEEVNLRISLTRNLYLAYEATRQFELALKYWREVDQLDDSLYNVESEEAIAEIEAKYQNEKQEKEITEKAATINLLEKDNRIKSLWTTGLGIGICLVLFSAIVGYRNFDLKARRKQELLEASLEMERHKQEYQNQKLTSYTLNFAQKNELLNELKENLIDLKKTDGEQLKEKLSRLRTLVDRNTTIDKDWEVFKTHFEGVHRGFFINLKKKHPELTPNDLKICALTLMNLNLKESSAIVGVSPNSVKISRHRIKKKMQLGAEESLFDYLMDFADAEEQK